MKRFLVTILAILYMAGAMGATVHLHYCMDKLAGVSLLHGDNDRCGRCGMKNDDRKKVCCKDEHKTFKTSAHQLIKASVDVTHCSFAVLPSFTGFFYPHPISCVYVNELAQTHAPPSLWRTCPIYIQVRNFRI